VLALAVVLGVFDAGFAETAWYPIALFLLALAVLVLVLAPPERRDRSRPFELAVLLFGLFTAWNYLSMLWADMPSDAWSAANRTLLYWLAFAVVGLRPWPAGAARYAVGFVGLGLAVLAGGTVVATAVADDPSTLFLGGRLAEPIGYANATANLWLIGVWPALHLAIARDVAWPVRGLGLAAATVLLEVALLSQSRGALLAFAFTAVAFVVLHPRHWAALAGLAVAVLAVVVGWDTLTEVRNATSNAALDDLMGDARAWIAGSAAVALVLGLVAGLLDGLARRRLPASPRRRRLVDGAFYAVALAGFVGLVAVTASSTGWLDARWDDFRTGSYSEVEGGDNRFGALGSGRYDFYRVSLDEFSERPVTGTGAENFAVPYLQHRRTGEAPRYAHSLGISVISTLGLVGTLLFAGFLIAAGVAFARVRLRGSPAARGVAVGALTATIAWLSHAMVDWLWEYPSLSLLGVGLLAVAARTTDREPGAGRGAAIWPLRTLPGRAVLGVLALAAAVSLALPGGRRPLRALGLRRARHRPRDGGGPPAARCEPRPARRRPADRPRGPGPRRRADRRGPGRPPRGDRARAGQLVRQLRARPARGPGAPVGGREEAHRPGRRTQPPTGVDTRGPETRRGSTDGRCRTHRAGAFWATFITFATVR
jgi:O-antigen ligase